MSCFDVLIKVFLFKWHLKFFIAVKNSNFQFKKPVFSVSENRIVVAMATGGHSNQLFVIFWFLHEVHQLCII